MKFQSSAYHRIHRIIDANIVGTENVFENDSSECNASMLLQLLYVRDSVETFVDNLKLKVNAYKILSFLFEIKIVL